MKSSLPVGIGVLDSTYIRGSEATDWLLGTEKPTDYAFYDLYPGLIIVGVNADQESNMLMRWDLSPDPATETQSEYAHVEKATLYLCVREVFSVGGAGFSGDLVLYPILNGSGDWVAEEATWNNRNAVDTWTTAGGDVSGEEIGRYSYAATGSGDGIWQVGYEIKIELKGSPDIGDGSLTALVNSWMDPDNPGFVITVENTTGQGHNLLFGSHRAPYPGDGFQNVWAPALVVDGILSSESSATPAEVILSDLSHTYDGTAKAATVTTNPAGLSYTVTYDGSTEEPVNAGSYAVTATITEPGYEGSASGTLTISMASTDSYVYQGEGTGYLDSASVRGPGGSDWHPWIEIADPGNYAFHDQPWHIGESWNVGDAINLGWAGVNHDQYSNILMRWDLSGGPAGETQALYEEVTSATLTMYVGHFLPDIQPGAWGGTIEVRPVLASSGDWVSSEATWNERKAGEQWTAPGGDVAGDIIGSYDDYVTYGFDSGIWAINYEVEIQLQGSPEIGDGSLTALINSWASSDQSVNSGILLSILNHSDSMDHDIAFGSHNASNSNMIAPVLTVRGTLSSESSTTPAEVILSDLSHTYDGTAKAATVTTDPAGLSYTVTYDGSETAPINAGSYVVTATVTEPGYEGFVSDTLTIDAVTASGIPFCWLKGHDLPTDGSIDHEKIGDSPFTVWEEWIAGTNPNDITDILRMTEPPERTPEGFIVRWQSVADRTYTIERSRDLTGDPQFETVAAGIQGIDGISEHLDETAGELGLFFYRVVVERE